MKILSLSRESIDDADLNKFLNNFDKESTLKVLSSIFTTKFADEYSDYVNWIQIVPGVVNSVLVFCNGKDTSFSYHHFERLAVMISAYDDKLDNSIGSLEGVYKSFMRVNRHCEYGNYVQGRLKIIFDHIKSNSGISFQDMVGIKLEDIFIPVWGSFALGGKGQNLPLIGKNFFINLKIPQSEIDKILDVIENKLSTDLSSAKAKAFTKLKTIKISSSIFEVKPFLKIGQEYLLVAPHFVMNDLISICASLFISGYNSNPQNDASKFYGEAFEKYVQSLLLQTMPDADIEPSYGNNPDAKGVDFVFIKKNKTPLLVEIHKAVIHRSLFEDFELSNYESFLKTRIIPKVKQTFKWLQSHNLNFNDVDLNGYKKSFRFVICLSASLPLLNFNEPADLLLKLINDEWENVFNSPGDFTMYNIFVLGCYDVELISTVARLRKRTFVSLLYQYRNYYFKHTQLRKAFGGIEVRQDFTAWIQDQFNSICFSNENLISASDQIFADFMERSFGLDKGSYKKPHKPD